MRKIGLVIRREYLFNLKRPAFLFAAFGMPVFFIFIFFISAAFAAEDDVLEFADLVQGEFAVGYVDYAGIVLPEVASERYMDLFQAYEREEAAREALNAGTLDAYLVVPEDYLDTGRANLYDISGDSDRFQEFAAGLLTRSVGEMIDTDLPTARVVAPVNNVTIQLLDSGREVEQDSVLVLLLLPFFFGVIFTLASQVTSSFLMSGLVEEKTNRIMEILVTSITPMQMLVGKIVGLGLLGLTQLTVWSAVAIGIIVFGGNSIEFLEGVVFPVDLLVVAVIYFILGYFLTASILAGLGSVVGSEQESRQYAGVLSLILFIPYFFIVQFITDSNGTIPVILSIFPLTAPMAMVIRFGLVSVPVWQLALSIGLLLVSTVLIAWLAARIFRWSLLLYGKRFSLGMLQNALRSRSEMATVATEES